MTFAWGADQEWLIAYVGAVIAILALIRLEVGRIRERGEAFHSEFAPHVRKLQQSAWNALVERFPGLFPQLRELLSNPPATPTDDSEEDRLRRQFQAASSEVADLASAVNSISEPDLLFLKICASYTEKADRLWYAALACLTVSLLIPTYLILDATTGSNLSSLVLGVMVEAGVIGIIFLLRFFRRLSRASTELDRDRAILVEQVDQKVHHIQKVPLVEVPPANPLP